MDFLLTSGNKGIFDDEAASLGARLHYLKYGKGSLLQFRRQFRRILSEGHYNAVHDHQDYASGWHFLLGGLRLPDVRVTHVHNPSYQIHNNYGVTKCRRLTAFGGKFLVSRWATHIAGTSRQVVSEHGFDSPQFREVPKAALHCGFDPTRFIGDRLAAQASLCEEFGWQEDAKIVLFAGRIDQSPEFDHPQNHKNSAFAVDVGIAAARKEPHFRLVLAGQPSIATPVLEKRISAAGLEGKIRFLGVRHDIARLMLGSNALLFPSRGEGLGMVAVEAQAAGLPVLMSTAVPRECIVVQGLVHQKSLGDGSTSWAIDLLALLRKERQDPSVPNRRVAESPFSIQNSAKALSDLYLAGDLPIFRSSGCVGNED